MHDQKILIAALIVDGVLLCVCVWLIVFALDNLPTDAETIPAEDTATLEPATTETLAPSATLTPMPMLTFTPTATVAPTPTLTPSRTPTDEPTRAPYVFKTPIVSPVPRK